jgi:hypothetical protein
MQILFRIGGYIMNKLSIYLCRSGSNCNRVSNWWNLKLCGSSVTIHMSLFPTISNIAFYCRITTFHLQYNTYLVYRGERIRWYRIYTEYISISLYVTISCSLSFIIFCSFQVNVGSAGKWRPDLQVYCASLISINQ